MDLPILLLQFLVLAVTAALWWLARRDLTARAAETGSRARAEWEALRATVEALIADLEARVEEADRRLAARIAEARTAPEAPAGSDVPAGAEAEPPARDDRYARVHELEAAGVRDPVEIARRTGLGRGEVELILGLRGRRTL